MLRNENSKVYNCTINGAVFISDIRNKIETAISLLPDKIHLTHITYESFIRMAKSKDMSVVSEAIKKNIILIGIEEYYRLLKNA